MAPNDESTSGDHCPDAGNMQMISVTQHKLWLGCRRLSALLGATVFFFCDILVSRDENFVFVTNIISSQMSSIKIGFLGRIFCASWLLFLNFLGRAVIFLCSRLVYHTAVIKPRSNDYCSVLINEYLKYGVHLWEPWYGSQLSSMYMYY